MPASTILATPTVIAIEVNYGDDSLGGVIEMSDGTFFAITNARPFFQSINKHEVLRWDDVTRERLAHWRTEYRENSVEISVFDFIIEQLEAKGSLEFGAIERLWIADKAPEFDERSDALPPLRQKLHYAQAMTKVWSLIKRWV